MDIAGLGPISMDQRCVVISKRDLGNLFALLTLVGLAIGLMLRPIAVANLFHCSRSWPPYRWRSSRSGPC
jgi:hypothetical protein